ncbi:LysR family transcriptional regulator [Burkholderia sp. RF2-non_BP3]|uniref:LysR family transcriptional regulator n=1 Tax=Burkholderia sp. RF2-non_BP3 TaxID=1637844 RepID=UPI0007549103|nr:LysR family transcriptional regulator [Burkholderia sp. RF2-non_BP3]KUY59115.1 LysR family transcriptional regulator [Burkholderia sp. RF2-non_BP3]
MKQLQDIDLKLLRIFMTIVKCGGFSAAQAALNVSQSTISEQMTSLETRLGVKLCERGRSGFRLTEHGVATYESAQRLALAVEAFCMDTHALKQRISGRLHLGIIDNTVTDTDSILPLALRRFVSRGHDVQLDIYIGTPAELEERVLDGRLHLAIGHFPLTVAGLSYTQLYEEPDGLYCSRYHPLFSTDATGDALIERVRQSQVVARAFLQQRDLQLLESGSAAATVDNVEAQAILILTGAYIGFLPRHYARQWVDAGQMRQLAAEQLTSAWPFSSITRRGVAQPTVLRAFLDDLMAQSGNRPAPADR